MNIQKTKFDYKEMLDCLYTCIHTQVAIDDLAVVHLASHGPDLL